MAPGQAGTNVLGTSALPWHCGRRSPSHPLPDPNPCHAAHRHACAAASQYVFLKTGILRPEKRKMAILNNISSIIQPGRTTLLLGPPAAGKSTLLKALAGKLARERGLKVRFASSKTPFELTLLRSMLQPEPLLAGLH